MKIRKPKKPRSVAIRVGPRMVGGALSMRQPSLRTVRIGGTNYPGAPGWVQGSSPGKFHIVSTGGTWSLQSWKSKNKAAKYARIMRRHGWRIDHSGKIV